MLIRLNIFLLTLVTFSSCRHQNPLKSPEAEKSKVVKLSFEVDDTRRYPAPAGVYRDKFIFSPIDSTDKIWADSHELDLLTGEWTSLDSKFGVRNAVNIQEGWIWTDSLTCNVYIKCCSSDLIEYNSQSRTFKILQIQAVSSFLAHQNFIFIGSPYGLYTYTRGADSIMRVADFPYGIPVYGIEALSVDSLRLIGSDEDIIYRIRDSKLFKTVKKDIPHQKNDPDLSGVLPATGLYRTIKDDTLTWMYHPADIYVKQGENILHVTNLDSGYLRQINVDSRYLYLLFNHQFVVMNKAAAIRSAGRFDAASYQTELNALQTLTSRENLNLQQLIFKIDSLQQRYGNSMHPDIRQRVRDLDNTVGYAAFNDQLRPELEHALQQGTLPGKFKKSAFTHLIQHYTRKDDLDQVLRYYKQLRKTYPDDPEDDAISRVVRIKTSIDSIENLPATRDKKLYLQTLEKYKLMRTSWFGESYLDDTIVADSYQKLLSTYPNSEFADNADFYLLNRDYSSEGGPSYSREAIEDYERFIKKYPRSELRIDASLAMIEMSINFSGAPEEQFNILRKAKTDLSRLNVKTMTGSQKEAFSYYNSTVDSKLKVLQNTLVR